MIEIAINFFKWLCGRDSPAAQSDVVCRELFSAAQETVVRDLCFAVCVDMVANAFARCEFRTYRDGEETQDREYFLWNVEPNVNQNSTAFLHKLVSQLFWKNEALVVSARSRNATGDSLFVADSWVPPEKTLTRQNEYAGVSVGDFTFSKTFREQDVLHITLNNVNVKPVLDAMNKSYAKMIDAAQRAYQWDRGQHWKVHIDDIAGGRDDFQANFAKVIADQVKPFLTADMAVLPEFNGYAYEKVPMGGSGDTRDLRSMIDDVFDYTARALQIPAVLVNGTIEGTADANSRFLTYCLDPICDQLQEEIVRKRYGFDEWRRGNTLRVDSSSILHFDLFANAANIEKIIGSGTFTINDVRRAANQAPINAPWANESHMTLNIARADQATRTLTKEGDEENV